VGSGSSVVLARVGDTEVAYVADADDHVVRALDAERLTELDALDVGGAPDQLLLTKAGRLYATVRSANELVAIEGTGLGDEPIHVAQRVHTPAEPVGLATPPDESVILVASGWGHTLAAYSPETLEARFTTDLGREPRSVVTSDDGKRAFVSHAVGFDVDVVDLADPSHPVHTAMKGTESLGEGRFALGDFNLLAGQAFTLVRSLAPQGRVFVPHARIRPVLVKGMDDGMGGGEGHYGSPEFGPTEQFDVAVLDEDNGAALRVSLDTDGGLACVLPRAAAVTDAGELLVACLGTSTIVAMDAAAANPHQAILESWNVAAGPSGIAVDTVVPRALVWSQFDHALTWIPLEGKGSFVLASASLPRMQPLPELVARGRVLFHLSDKSISQDGRACASCHPDGRDDGLVWATPDGPRNPPMLAGRLDHAAPYGWLGSSADVPGHLKKTFARLGSAGLKDEDKAALVAYVLAMKPPPVEKPDLSQNPLALEGQHLFESDEAGCTGCHGDYGDTPDGLTHNVKSWASGDVRGAFDTPSLRFIGGTAPYFHDGRYASLRSLLDHTRGTMGQKKKLSPHELDALEAYVVSL
jgi:DNA-binding beta-propeller fold protein YncE/mono/diheme cytochrome c family protein